MTEHTSNGKGHNWPPDRELRSRTILLAGLALLLATVAAGIVSWWLATSLRDRMVESDPPPPALLEAMGPFQPPSPNLQTDPTALLEAQRRLEESALGAWEWNDDGRSATVPIERAMELLLETRPDGRAFGDADATPEEATDES